MAAAKKASLAQIKKLAAEWAAYDEEVLALRRRHPGVFEKFDLACAGRDAALEHLKMLCREHSVLGETYKIVETPEVVVTVQGVKGWDPKLVEEHFPAALASALIYTERKVNAPAAQGLVDRKTLSIELARKAWVAETPRVLVRRVEEG